MSHSVHNPLGTHESDHDGPLIGRIYAIAFAGGLQAALNILEADPRHAAENIALLRRFTIEINRFPPDEAAKPA